MLNIRESLGFFTFLGLLLCSLTLGGCAQNYSSPQQAASDACQAFGPRAKSGALIGLVAGAAGGAGIAAAATHGNGTATLIGLGLGAATGLMAGMEAGHHLDQGDCAAAQQALQQMSAQPTGAALSWNNQTTGSHGTFTPTGGTYDDPSGQVCRPFVASYTLQGQQAVTNDQGITCRTADGDWARQPAPQPAAPAPAASG